MIKRLHKGKIKKFLNGYSKNKGKYKEMAKVVAYILELACKKLGTIAIITHREKGIESLETKLEKNDTYKRLEDCTDLAGVRILFYSEKELKEFVSHLQEYFEIDHKHSPGFLIKRSGYESYHYVVSLKKDRSSLIDFADLNALKCEIQMNTIVRHAWTEEEHDIYKIDPEIEKRYPYEVNNLKSIFAETLNKINEVESYFNLIKECKKRLREGKSLPDIVGLKSIANLVSNKLISERLDDFEKYIFTDKTSFKKAYEQNGYLWDILKKIIEKSKKNEVEIVAGMFKNTTIDHNYITSKVLKLVSKIKRIDPSQFVDFLLYVLPIGTAENKSYISKLLVEISKYDIHTINNDGFTIQLKLLANIPKPGTNFLDIYKSLLSFMAEGERRNNDTLQILRMPLPISENLQKIRNDVFDMLFEIYKDIPTIDEKVAILDIIYFGLRVDYRINLEENQAVKEEIGKNKKKVYEFLENVISQENVQYSILYKIEWIINNLSKSDTDDSGQNIIQSIRQKPYYQVYYNIFIPSGQWLGNRIADNYKEDRKKQIEQTDCFVETFTEQHFTFLRQVISEDKEKSRNINMAIRDVLDKLVTRKHEVMKRFWKENQGSLDEYMAIFLKCLSEEELICLIEGGKSIDRIVSFLCQSQKNYNKKTIDILFKKLTKANTEDIPNILNQFVNYFLLTLHQSSEIENRLQKTIKQMDIHETGIRVFGLHEEALQKTIQNLSEKTLNIILKNLVYQQSIDYETDEILGCIAQKYPEKVFNFFERRSKESKRDKYKIDDIRGPQKYEIIPYNSYHIEEAIKSHKQGLACFFVSIVQWYKYRYDGVLFSNACNFFTQIFPAGDFSSETSKGNAMNILLFFQKEIENISKNNKKLRCIIELLKEYEGNENVYPLVKSILE